MKADFVGALMARRNEVVFQHSRVLSAD